MKMTEQNQALESYEALCDLHEIDPARAVMLDDIPHNLEPAAEIGMTTVWIRTSAAWAQDVEPGPHIHHHTDDIAAWLEGIVGAG